MRERGGGGRCSGGGGAGETPRQLGAFALGTAGGLSRKTNGSDDFACKSLQTLIKPTFLAWWDLAGSETFFTVGGIFLQPKRRKNN